MSRASERGTGRGRQQTDRNEDGKNTSTTAEKIIASQTNTNVSIIPKPKKTAIQPGYSSSYIPSQMRGAYVTSGSQFAVPPFQSVAIASQCRGLRNGDFSELNNVNSTTCFLSAQCENRSQIGSVEAKQAWAWNSFKEDQSTGELKPPSNPPPLPEGALQCLDTHKTHDEKPVNNSASDPGTALNNHLDASSSSAKPIGTAMVDNTKFSYKQSCSYETEAHISQKEESTECNSTISSSPSLISSTRGDPRMNRAVVAKVANTNLSLLEALLEGGFEFPNSVGAELSSDKHIYDSDGISLFQRKNQLNRRLRKRRKMVEEKDESCSDPSLERMVKRVLTTYQNNTL